MDLSIPQNIPINKNFLNFFQKSLDKWKKYGIIIITVMITIIEFESEDKTMLDKNVSKLINEQINKELYSAYLYLDFSIYYESQGLDGFANWYMIQAQEERDHAMLMLKYLQNNGEEVTLEAVGKPDKEYSGLMDPLKFGFEHEQYVTSLINDIYGAAYAVKDFRTMQFLDWFVKEQLEEEKSADDMIKKMELFGNDSKGLYSLDAEYAARVYTAPSLTL